MLFPPLIRVFFAIDLPREYKEKITDFITTLKKKSKSHAIRWTKPENLHITLQFLAEVASDHIDTLLQHVRAELEDVQKPCFIHFGAQHLFPNPYRPRVIVLTIENQNQLAELAEKIAKGILKTNYSVESRPFRAHLTLGRIKYTQGVNLNFLNDSPSLHIGEIAVNEVILFRSEPQPEGSKYSVIEKISLSKKQEDLCSPQCE